MACNSIQWPIITMRPGAIYAYPYTLDSPSKSRWQTDNAGWQNLDRDRYQGKITPHGKKRMFRAMDLLLAISQEKTAINFTTGKPFTFKINFITLTLSAMQEDIPDKLIKKECFSYFLDLLRKQYNFRSYLWRAERQKNGNLHFHIVSDCYLPYWEVRDLWNHCQDRLGFIQRFHKKHGHVTPNSTDIHSVHKIKDVAAYIAKYISKETEGDESIEGRIWDCSENLKAKIKCQFEGVGSDYDHWKTVQRNLKECRVKMDYVDYYSCKEEKMLSAVPPSWSNQYSEYLFQIRNYRTKYVESIAQVEKPEIVVNQKLQLRNFPPELFPNYTGN